VRGEESAVAYENSHGHLLGHCLMLLGVLRDALEKGLTPIFTDETDFIDKDEMADCCFSPLRFTPSLLID